MSASMIGHPCRLGPTPFDPIVTAKPFISASRVWRNTTGSVAPPPTQAEPSPVGFAANLAGEANGGSVGGRGGLRLHDQDAKCGRQGCELAGRDDDAAQGVCAQMPAGQRGSSQVGLEER